MKTHKLKIYPSAFKKIVAGTKTCEFRKNDRDFDLGDELELQEFDPSPCVGFTGMKITAGITDITYGGRFDVPVGFCMMSIRIRKEQ